jgi:hypothetical protein
MYFFGVFVCVYDYDGFSFVGPDYHGVFSCQFFVYVFYDVSSAIL